MFVSYSPSMHRVLVVGSGIQGLSKAIKHHLLGHQVVILEKREQIGGRGSGDSIRGFSLENGPHFLLKNGPLYKLIKKVGGIKPMYRPLLPQKIQIAGVGKLLPMDSPSALLQYKKGLDKVREDAAIFVSSWGLDLPLRKRHFSSKVYWFQERGGQASLAELLRQLMKQGYQSKRIVLLKKLLKEASD